jgi:O-acetyl-ADP-ribose deacetylase (regulator of RNase III)
MRFRVNQSIVELVQGNIVEQDVDAIVNAANSSLLGGGGVDGAIHHAAGPELLAECRTLGGCQTGEARITKGYRLKARQVIHTVGPVYRTVGRIIWSGEDDAANDARPEAALLASAYRSSLQLASQHGIKTIAFPSLSTGAYGYPLAEAAPIALRTVRDYLAEHREIELVRFVLWDGTARVAFEKAARQILSNKVDDR